jgi:hypothetical protein
VTRRITVSVFLLVFFAAGSTRLAWALQEPATRTWKRYLSSEYGFEIAYPADWEFVSGYQNDYGKPPSTGQGPADGGETRDLFGLEMDGPTQSQDGGGSFDDGAIVDVRVTGTSGTVEDRNIKPGGSWYLLQSAPSDWVKVQTSLGPGDGLKRVAVDTNGFTGAIEVVCIGHNPCKPFEEEGAAYRTLPSGRVLLVTWDRETGGNDFSYQKFFLPMLSSFKLLK